MKKLTHLIVVSLILTCSLIFSNNIPVHAITASYDFNNDSIIDILDVAKVASTYNLKADDGNWNSTYDLNGDNVIDIFDLVKISKAIGTRLDNQPPISTNPYYTGSDPIVAYAFQFIGTPYLWGGTTPSGFDCSGFVQYVYAHFGMGIARVSEDQVRDGYEVASNQLKSGDLVFFGDISAPHHVGMYIGNGQYIHAPKIGDFIKVSDLASRSDYCTARRIRD